MSSVTQAADLLRLDEGREALDYCNSYERAPTLLHLHPQMQLADWFVLLGEAWTMCDNLGRYRDKFFRILNKASPAHRQLMMTPEERAAHARLPDRFLVYRGCYQCNRNGLSYTMDKHLAQRFPLLHRYRMAGPPLLITSLTWREKAVLKLDREEAEIIAIRRRRIDLETLNADERLKAPGGHHGY